MPERAQMVKCMRGSAANWFSWKRGNGENRGVSNECFGAGYLVLGDGKR